MSQDDLRFNITAENETARAFNKIQDDLRKLERKWKAVENAGMGAGRSMSTGLGTASNRARTYGTQVDKASRHTANLTAQFNDIGVMLNSGQSPLTLAMQQGTQINQVFQQMGGGKQALRAIGPAIMSMINPMSLAVIGSIAGGAALFQLGKKALGASEDVGELEKALEGLEKQTAKAEEKLALFKSGLGTSEELVVYQKLNLLLEERDKLQQRVNAGGHNAATALVRDQARSGLLPLNREIAGLEEKLAKLQRFRDEFNALQAAERQRAAFLTGQANARKSAEALAIANMNKFVSQMSGAIGVAEKVGDTLTTVEGITLSLAGVDLSKPISEATVEAGKLATQFGISLKAAISLKNLRDGGVYISPNGDPNAFNPLLPPANTNQSRSDGGGVNSGLIEARQLFESTRTQAESYEAAIARINELHREFPKIVNEEVRGRALDGLKDDFRQLDGLALQSANAIRSAFDGLFDNQASALQRLSLQLTQMALYTGLANSFPGAFGKGGVVPLLNANGNVFSGGNVVPFARGGIVSGPTVFPMAGGRTGVMGEAGMEGVLPLTRIGGKLGVFAEGGGNSMVVNVINKGSGTARTERRRGPNGQEIVDVIIEEGFARGRYDRAQKGRFGNSASVVKR